jgi:MerR family transcriptional regulator, light-induced transcriptional regulator
MDGPEGTAAPAGRLTGLLLAGRRREALELCRERQRLLPEEGYLAVGVDLLQPALYEIGELWAAHWITVAEEHLASMVAGWIMTTLALEAAPPGGAAAAAGGRVREADGQGRGRAVLACVAGNQHALGLQLLGEALGLDGWDAVALGADVPTGDLVAVVARGRPELVGLSASQPDQVPAMRAAIAGCRLALGPRSGTTFAVGGLGLAGLPDPARAVGADRYFADARAAVAALRELAAAAAAFPPGGRPERRGAGGGSAAVPWPGGGGLSGASAGAPVGR